MSTILQVMLSAASLALIVLVTCLIPIAFQMRRRLEHLATSAEQLKTTVEVLVHESGETVKSVNELVKRANEHMEDVGQVAHVVRTWTDRADRLVGEVASAIEPPVLSLARNVIRYRAGATTFIQALFQRNQNNHESKKEKDYV